MTKYARTSEEFDRLVAGLDPRTLNKHPQLFDDEDWAVALHILRDRFMTLSHDNEVPVRPLTIRLLERRQLMTGMTYRGRKVDFHTYDRILESTYTKIFGAISVGAQTLPPEDRQRRKAPVPAKSNMDWQGPLGDLLRSLMTLMGPHYAIKDYVAQFVYHVQNVPGYEDAPFNEKALCVRVTRVKRELQVSKDAGKMQTKDQVLEDLQAGHPDEDEAASLFVDSPLATEG